MTALLEQSNLSDVGRFRLVSPNHEIFRLGDPVDSIAVIVKGVVLVRSGTAEGDGGAVDVRARGDVLGDSALLGPPVLLHLDTAVTLTECEILQVPLSAFEELRRTNPALGADIIGQLTDQARRLSSSLIDLLGRPVRVRAARRLRLLADALERSGMAGRELVITQRDLAELVGTTRSTLNSQLGTFQDERALTTARGRIVINDPEVLDRYT